VLKSGPAGYSHGMAWRVRTCLVALLLATLFAAEPLKARADAQSSERARQAHALARDLMSPFCPGRTLADCPSPDAAALRKEVRVLIDGGVDEAAIRARLEDRFGGAVIGVPRGVWGWILPVLILLAGAGVLVRVLRRIAGPAPSAEPFDDPELDEELERELRDRGL